jgi:hypothetical protein
VIEADTEALKIAGESRVLSGKDESWRRSTVLASIPQIQLLQRLGVDVASLEPLSKSLASQLINHHLNLPKALRFVERDFEPEPEKEIA